jgi:hypothetical protein
MPVLQAMFADDRGDEEMRATVHGWRVWRDEAESTSDRSCGSTHLGTA